MAADASTVHALEKGPLVCAMNYPLPKTKRKSGIPTGNAGEYFVMGELLRRGWDAQLADRNTQGYDLLAGLHGKPMQRVQVKTVRQQPWFVRVTDFSGPR